LPGRPANLCGEPGEWRAAVGVDSIEWCGTQRGVSVSGRDQHAAYSATDADGDGSLGTGGGEHDRGVVAGSAVWRDADDGHASSVRGSEQREAAVDGEAGPTEAGCA